MTRRDDLRKLGVDPRIVRSHPDPDGAPRLWNAALLAPMAVHSGTEARGHRRWRRAVSGRLGAAHTETLRRRAGELCEEFLDSMITDGAPADLHAAFAEPFASRLNFDVIGVPRHDYGHVRALSEDLRTDDRSHAAAAYAATAEYLTGLLEHKRAHPAEDVLSDLATARDADGPLPTEQALDGAYRLVIGAHETVSTRITLGTLALLTHPDQYTALATRSSPVRDAVEEILRFAVPGGSWIPRYAGTDIDHNGTLIRAGEMVVFFVQSANRDENVFEEPDRFDITREPNPHVAFGHGNYHCTGAPLSRLGLTTVMEILPPRLPGLRVYEKGAGLTTKDDTVTGGLRTLPVTW
ncbi:cytochrome P450 [Streptomyces sp. NPDC054874]